MFRRAVLRLTVAYSLVQLALFAAVAAGVYAYISSTFDFDPAPAPGEGVGTAAATAEQAFDTLRTGLLVGFALLVVVVPIASYLMARAAIAPLRAGFQAPERFLDDASHEFRTPLGSIAGELELALSREREPEEYRAAMRRSLAAAERMSRLTTDLLQLGRGGRDGTAGELVELREVVTDALPARTVTVAAGDERVSAAITVEFERSPVVLGSHELLVRAVGNIVENAVKFTPAEGTITVRVTERGGLAVIEVVDSGPGISRETEQHAFERFWRAESSRSVPGHGLGLALVQEIVRSHHGRVSLHPDAAGGTRATIELPRVH